MVKVNLKITKKGALFTIASIVITGILLSVFFSLQETPADRSTHYLRTKIKQTNNYLNQIEEFTKENLKEVTIATLNEMINHINTTHKFSNTPQEFDENLYKCILNQSTAWCSGQNSIQSKLKKFGDFGIKYVGLKNLTIKVKDGNNILVKQEDPWHITTEVVLEVYANDGYAEWNITNLTIDSVFSIEGLRDPTYYIPTTNASSIGIINKYHNYSRVIFTRNVSEWRTYSGFNNYMGEGMYFNTTIGVSYLDRLRNNITPSTCCGIASFLTNEIVEESQAYSGNYKENYGNYDILFFKQIPLSSSPWILEELDFWNQESTINNQLPEVRSLVEINNITGANINRTIVPRNLVVDVNMPIPIPPKNYTIPPHKQFCGDNICVKGIEDCGKCPADCGVNCG